MAEPIGSYDPALSRKKAWTETASSLVSLLLPMLGALFLDDTFRAAVLAAVKDNPKVASAVALAYPALRFAVKFYADKRKHQDPAYHIEHGVSPARAEMLAVVSGADPAEAKAETVVAVAEMAAEKVKQS